MVKLNTQSFQRLGKKVIKLGKRAAPAVLIVFGMGAAWNSGFQAGKNKPKADELIAKKKEELGVEKLSVVETVKTTAPVYWPAAVSGVVAVASTGAGIGFEEMRVSSAIGTANGLAKELMRYKDATNKVMSDEQKEEVAQKVTQQRIADIPKKELEKDPPKITDVDSIPILYQDEITGQSFWSTEKRINDAEKMINRYLFVNNNISKNTYLDYLDDAALDVSWTDVKVNNNPNGDLLGTTLDHGAIELRRKSYPCGVGDRSVCVIQVYQNGKHLIEFYNKF